MRAVIVLTLTWCLTSGAAAAQDRLIDAIKADDVATVRALLDKRVDVNAVQAGIKEGKSVQELQKTIRLEKYRKFAGYAETAPATPSLEAVIQSAYTSLTRYSTAGR